MPWRVLRDRPTAVTGVAMCRGVNCGIGLLPLQGWPCRAVACTVGKAYCRYRGGHVMPWRVLWDRPTTVTGVAMSCRAVYCGIGLLPLQGWPCRAVACTVG